MPSPRACSLEVFIWYTVRLNLPVSHRGLKPHELMPMRGVPKKCTRVAGRVFPDGKVTWPQPSDCCSVAPHQFNHEKFQMTNPIPCCGQQVQNYWRGRFCRCCGESIVFSGMVVGCARQEPCPHCNQTTCGPHSHDGSGGWPRRRHCELCGEPCDNGVCREHGMRQAT